MRRTLQNCIYVLLSRQGKFEIGISRYKGMQLTEHWVGYHKKPLLIVDGFKRIWSSEEFMLAHGGEIKMKDHLWNIVEHLVGNMHWKV